MMSMRQDRETLDQDLAGSFPDQLQICSYRGPVTFTRRAGMIVKHSGGPGGLERLVQSVAGRAGGRWLFSATSTTDREIARAFPDCLPHDPWLRMLPVRPELHRGHYDVIGGLVADVCHYSLDSREPIPDRASLAIAWRSYLAVNEAYAGALAATSASVTLIQDHHLLLVAAALRRSTVAARQRPLHYFHHIPWCEPAYFGLLPEPIRRKLLIGALAHDTVAFHTRRWASAFIRCCERFLPGADCGDDEVTWVGRAVSVCAIPGTIDAEELRVAARTPAVGALAKRLSAESRGRSTVVRVDRWTPAKNALRGFLALEQLLDRRPDQARQLWFLAVLSVPTGDAPPR